MSSRTRRQAGVVAISVIVMASGCGADDSSEGGQNSVTLEASGSGTEAEVTYGEGATVTETVDLPWSLTLDVGEDWSQELVVTNLDGTGTVACTITEEAFPRPVTADGEASARCTASVSGGNADYETEGIAFGDETEPPPGEPPTSEGTETGGGGEDVSLSEPLDSAGRSIGVGGVIWVVDGSTVVAIDTGTGEVRRLESEATTEFDTLAVGANRVAVIESAGLEVHAAAADADRLVPVEGLERAIHLAIAQDMLWVTTGTLGDTMTVIGPRGQEVATFAAPGVAPAVIAETENGAFAIDLNKSEAYFVDLATQDLFTVELPDGAELGWAAPLGGGDVVSNTTSGDLLIISPTEARNETVDAPPVDRLWADGDGGAVLRFDDGRFGRFDGATRTVGDPVALPAEVDPDEVAAVTDGAIWFWTPDLDGLVEVGLDELG